MKKISISMMLVLSVAFLCFNPLFAQEPKTDTEKKALARKRTAGTKGKRAGSVSTKGCLQKGTEANCFTLTTSDNKVYSFQNPEAEKHIGHLVSITGKRSNGASTCMQGTFVTDVTIKHISKECPDKGKSQ